MEACGFDPTPIRKQPVAQLIRDEETGKMKVQWTKAQDPYYNAPNSWNFSIFLKNLIGIEKKQEMVTGMVKTLREQLMEELPDFGKHLGYDGKAIESYSTGQKRRETDQTSDPDADWGKHETKGVDKNGKVWNKVKSWFGYCLHLIADTVYEIPVAFHVTPACGSEQIELRSMARETFEETPELAKRCDDFTADRGLDSAETKALLWGRPSD